MKGPVDNNESIDRKTSRSICNAIGERLQQRLQPESDLPPRLERLLDRLRRHDAESGATRSAPFGHCGH